VRAEREECVVERPTVVRGSELGAGQVTAGMTRREAFSGDGVWIGAATTEPSAVSAWHHHGEHFTYVYCVRGALRVESGPAGSEAVEAGEGDFIHIPPRVVHRESNPSEEVQHLVVARFGSGPVVVNVDGLEG
jgi:uncharacterized RmlC-like cupin family protein